MLKSNLIVISLRELGIQFQHLQSILKDKRIVKNWVYNQGDRELLIWPSDEVELAKMFYDVDKLRGSKENGSE